MKHHYTDLATALADPEGVAVLGFFYEVKSLTGRVDKPGIVPAGVALMGHPVFMIPAFPQRQPQVRPHRERSPEHQSGE